MLTVTFARMTGAKNAIRILLTLLSLAIVASGCDSPTAPTSPLRPPTSFGQYTLSGVVSEMTADGPVPLRDALVTDTSTAQASRTDANGFYRITQLGATSHALTITRTGYVTETRKVDLTGDTQLDIRLARLESHTLSGVVFEITEAGQVPIEGAEVYCDSCGSPDGHTFVYTDANGFYSLAWTLDGVHPLYVTKTGYDIFDPTGTLRDQFGRIAATVKGDTRFDIRLAHR